MRVPTTTLPPIDALRHRIGGRVVSPDDPDYDAMRTIMTVTRQRRIAKSVDALREGRIR